MTTRASWLNRLGFLLVWILLTAGVSFYVARTAATEESPVDVSAPLPPVTLDQRATVSLEQATIVPVVSATGTVVNYNGTWMLEAPATSDDVAYRLLDPPVGVRAQISGGPSGFECPWVGLGQSGVPDPADAEDGMEAATPAASPVANSSSGLHNISALVPIGEDRGPGPLAEPESPTTSAPVSTSGVTLRCAIPADVRVAAGMRGLMVLRMDQPSEVQALPVTAVVGGAGQGQVVVVHNDGTTETRTVKLGVSDIYNIEIADGLDSDEAVLQNPTQADFAQAGERD